jgi:hypothetical protein
MSPGLDGFAGGVDVKPLVTSFTRRSKDVTADKPTKVLC